jgi:uncharacterized RmlC-like cupin family protein
MSEADESRWRFDGVRVVRASELDPNTPQTPGMSRAAAITYAKVGAEKLWAGKVTIHPKARTGPHHHGQVESVIYVLKGKARMRWGERLQFTAEADPGDFIYVPPFVPHQEINARDSEPLECVIIRSGQVPVQRTGAGGGESRHRARRAPRRGPLDRRSSQAPVEESV